MSPRLTAAAATFGSALSAVSTSPVTPLVTSATAHADATPPSVLPPPVLTQATAARSPALVVLSKTSVQAKPPVVLAPRDTVAAPTVESALSAVCSAAAGESHTSEAVVWPPYVSLNCPLVSPPVTPAVASATAHAAATPPSVLPLPLLTHTISASGPWLVAPSKVTLHA